MAYTEASKKYYKKNKDILNEKAKEKYHNNAKEICEKRKTRATVRYGRCKRSAEKRNISFNLTFEEFEQWWNIRPEMCPIFNKNLTNPSIDRIFNNKGYELNNIQCISVRANSLKKDGTPLEHLQIAIHGYELSGNELRLLFENEIKRLK